MNTGDHAQDAIEWVYAKRKEIGGIEADRVFVKDRVNGICVAECSSKRNQNSAIERFNKSNLVCRGSQVKE